MADVAFPSDALSDVRADFIRATKRYNLIANGNISTNTDNGANRYINMGQSYLDLRIDHPRLRRQRRKQKMAVGDFSVEVQGLILVDTIALLDKAEPARYDITDNVMDSRTLKDWVGKPIRDYETGRPFWWAINDIGLTLEHFSGTGLVNPTTNTAVTTGTQTQTYAVTATQDDSLHQIAHDTGVLDMYYEFNVSTIGSPTNVEVGIRGRLNGINDSLTVSGYNWTTAAWVSVGTMLGRDSLDLRTDIYVLDTSFVGTGAEEDLVRLRFNAASGLTVATLSVDHAFCAPSLVDYEDVHFGVDETHDGIIFSSKADKAYDVEIVGKFYSKILDTDTDKTFWTVRHPDLLVLAAAYCYEREQRNTSGMRDWLEGMQPLIDMIDDSGVEQELSGKIMRLEA